MALAAAAPASGVAPRVVTGVGEATTARTVVAMRARTVVTRVAAATAGVAAAAETATALGIVLAAMASARGIGGSAGAAGGWIGERCGTSMVEAASRSPTLTGGSTYDCCASSMAARG